MKKFLLLCFLLMAFAAPAAAQPIDLVIDGKSVQTDVAPYIASSGRTMVPVRVISDNLGATVQWDGKARKVTVAKAGLSLVLSIDSPTAIVNDQKKPLEAPATIKQGRTMVPLRFIAEAFGSDVHFDPSASRVSIVTPGAKQPPAGETRAFTGMTWGPSGNDLVVNVALTGVDLGTEKTFTLQNPDRLVVDLTNTDFAVAGAGASQEFAINNSVVAKARTSQFDQDNHITRLVFDLTKASDYEISRTASGISVRFRNAPQTPPPPPATANTDASAFLDMDWAREGNDLLVTVKLARPEKAKETVTVLENPDRLMVDLGNTAYGITDDDGNAISSKDFKIYNPLVFKARTSEYNKEKLVSRIVFDLYGKPDYEVKRTANGLTIRFKSVPTPPKTGPYKIFIDAGHGGQDPGAIGRGGAQEKGVVLEIAKKVEALLKKEVDKDKKPRFQVMMLRSDDTFVDLEGRVDRTLRFNPHLFVSIHANSAGSNKSPNGTETYYRYEGYRPFAEAMQRAVIQTGQRYDRGVKQANFWVLAPIDVPSVLVETAFLSNPEEEALLGSSEFQDKMAQGIVAGIKTYLGVN